MLQTIIYKYGVEQKWLKAIGFDEAVIGVEEKKMRLIYSVKKCLEILQKDMTEDEAEQYFYYNVCDSYVGEQTPIWCFDNFD